MPEPIDHEASLDGDNASALSGAELQAEITKALASAGPPDAPPSRSFTPPSNGEVIVVNGSYYFVGEFLGAGAFGHVYACTDEWSNDLVAKILVPRDQTYEEVRASWMGELTKLAALRHPNVTYVHAAFEHKDTFYIIMERCSMTLDSIINLSGLEGELWVPYVARDILQGLSFIHSAGYIHKDIHAGNIFVSQITDRMVPTKDPVWSFKIGDLGISRLETEVRAFNTLLAQWMLPPEAIDPAQFGTVSRATDIYHVGLLLLAILLGHSPSFTQDEIVDGQPRKMAERLKSKYSVPLSRALRRHVQARTPTAMQFWREIQSASESADAGQNAG